MKRSNVDFKGLLNPRVPGRHPYRRLTAITIRNLAQPGRYGDGNGLYLVVDPSGNKRWILRTVIHGVRRDLGLGGYRLVSLAEAREKALVMRKIARSGGDPMAGRRLPVLTFEKAALKVHADHRGSWKNAKHAAQWLSSLREYAFPRLGSIPVDRIETPDILAVLAPIWLAKPETARRVRQRIKTVFDYCKSAGLTNGANPVDGVAKGLPKQPRSGGHFKALHYSKVGAFVVKLRATLSPAHLAFEFLILTAARTSEVLKAAWREVDLESRTWTIPAGRMKAGREHRVPLCDRCVEILTCAQAFGDGSPEKTLFPTPGKNRPLSNMALLMILRRLGAEFTAHGFRSAFRDWAAEETHFPREVCEMALAHTIGDKTEAAYRRGDLFEKRRELMDAWSLYVEG